MSKNDPATAEQIDIEDAIDDAERAELGPLGPELKRIRLDRETNWVGGSEPANRHYWYSPPSLRVVAEVVGISHTKLSRVESDKTELTLGEFVRLCCFYRLPDAQVAELLKRSLVS